MQLLWSVLVSVNARQSRAQSEGDNATAVAPLTISIKLTKSGIHADRTAKFAPDEVTAENATVQELIQSAYDIKDDQIVGAPGWLNSPRYDIEAKVDTSAAGQGEPGGKSTLQTLLSNRFKLAAHRETRLIPV